MEKRFFLTLRKSFCGAPLACLFFLSALLLSSQCLYAQADAQPQESEPTLEKLGSLMHTSLDNLTNHSKSLIEELETRSTEVGEWKAKFNALITYSENTNKRLYDSETKCVRLETEKKMLKKSVVILSIVSAVLLLLLIAAIYLLAKKVALPFL